MSVKLLGKLRAAFRGFVADSTQIARNSDENSISLDAALNTIENNAGNIPQVLVDLATHSTEQHTSGDVIYDPGFDRALEVKIADRTARTGSLIGDTDGVTLDGTGNINGWQTVLGDWRNTIIGVHIAELNTPATGTRSLLKWRSGDTSYTLLGVTSDGHLFVNDPTTSVDSAVRSTNLVDGNILENEDGPIDFVAGMYVTLEIIVAGTGAISFVPAFYNGTSTEQLNFIEFDNAGSFNLNQIHLEHNLTATAFDRIVLAHTNRYLNRAEYTRDLGDNVESDIFNFRRTGQGLDYIEVDTPVKLLQSYPEFVHAGATVTTETGLMTDQVADVNTTIGATNSAVNTEIDMDLRFDRTKGSFNIPKDATYDDDTGEFVLPVGQWIVCTSVNVQNWTPGTQSGNRLWAKLCLHYGGNIRHAQSGYIRYSRVSTSQGGTASTEFHVSVAGVVNSDGVTATTINLTCNSQLANIGIRLNNAHIHAVRA